MIEHAIRLTRGTDLKKAISDYCQNNQIDTAIILCGVSCLSKLNIRLAKAIESKSYEQDLEIVSLIGTISKGQAHIHIAASDDKASVIGGHLLDGSIVNTTVELVLGELENYTSQRVFDEKTNYHEIAFERSK